MSDPLAADVVSPLRQAAHAEGMDIERPMFGNWLAFASTHTSLCVWLGFGTGAFLVAISDRRVNDALEGMGDPLAGSLPEGAVAGRRIATLHGVKFVLRRAFDVSAPRRTTSTRPAEPGTPQPENEHEATARTFDEFRQATASLPRRTEQERLTVQRVGQPIYRKLLLRYWEDRCALSGLAVPALLVASHIKPWAACATDEERLDRFNGLLLSAHMDRLFDGGYLTLEDDGGAVITEDLDAASRRLLGVDRSLRVEGLRPEHRGYLAYHRREVFEKWKKGVG